MGKTMGKRKGRKETRETPILPHQLPENGEKEEESGGKGGAGFFGQMGKTMGKRKGRKETRETPILPHQLPENGEKEEESGGKGGAGFFGQMGKTMGKRKGRKETRETPILPHQLPENGEKEEESGGKGGAGFFGCYLLTSLCPIYNGHTYIGYTVNPRRRIRQHNGEIRNGARQTKCKRPWEMVLCIYGFPTNIAALQFEWAWQYPRHSLAVRSAAASFKSLSGVANKIKLAYTMLTLPAWQRLNLTVNLFSTKYQKFTFACPALPQQIRTQIRSMDDLPCYNKKNSCDKEFEQEESREVHNSPPSYNEENENQEISHGYDAGVGLSECLAGTQVGQPTNSPDSPPYRQEDQGRSFCTNNSPAKSLFSFTSSFELSKEFDEAVDNRSATALVAEEGQALIKSPDVGRSQEVEMIDLLTPSTCYAAINSSSKKKRRATPCPEIIEPSGCFVRNSTESTLYREEDHNSPTDKTFVSFTSSFKLSREFDEAVGNRSATALVADEDQVLMKSPDVGRSQEVELIDLLTPSTCYAAINSGSKKKRRATPCPEIIEPSGCFGRNSTESTLYREEDRNSPADKTFFSFTSSFKLCREFDEAVGNRSATALVADEDQVLMKSPDIRSQGVEIIDLFTPSPRHVAVYSGCKKKRKPTLYPEIIIDLTNSPLYA